jgi:hypothetical protein
VREFLRPSAGSLEGGRQDRLHQLGARNHSLGISGQLRRVEGRHRPTHALLGPRAGTEEDTRKFSGARCHAYANQP